MTPWPPQYLPDAATLQVGPVDVDETPPVDWVPPVLVVVPPVAVPPLVVPPDVFVVPPLVVPPDVLVVPPLAVPPRPALSVLLADAPPLVGFPPTVVVPPVLAVPPDGWVVEDVPVAGEVPPVAGLPPDSSGVTCVTLVLEHPTTTRRYPTRSHCRKSCMVICTIDISNRERATYGIPPVPTTCRSSRKTARLRLGMSRPTCFAQARMLLSQAQRRGQRIDRRANA